MLTKFEIKQLESNLKKVTGFDLMQRLQGRHRFQSCEYCAFCCRLCLNYKKKERNLTSSQVFLLNATLVRSILPIAAVPLCALGQNFLPKILFGFTFWEFMSRQTWVPFIRGIKVGLFLLFFDRLGLFLLTKGQICTRIYTYLHGALPCWQRRIRLCFNSMHSLGKYNATSGFTHRDLLWE